MGIFAVVGELKSDADCFGCVPANFSAVGCFEWFAIGRSEYLAEEGLDSWKLSGLQTNHHAVRVREVTPVGGEERQFVCRDGTGAMHRGVLRDELPQIAGAFDEAFFVRADATD